jgi:DNA primase
LFTPEHELSLRWKEKLGIKKEYNIETDFLTEIKASLIYYKLRKVKKMILENQKDMEHASSEDQLSILQIHKHLKEVEKELTQAVGTVIFK